MFRPLLFRRSGKQFAQDNTDSWLRTQTYVHMSGACWLWTRVEHCLHFLVCLCVFVIDDHCWIDQCFWLIYRIFVLNMNILFVSRMVWFITVISFNDCSDSDRIIPIVFHIRIEMYAILSYTHHSEFCTIHYRVIANILNLNIWPNHCAYMIRRIRNCQNSRWWSWRSFSFFRRVFMESFILFQCIHTQSLTHKHNFVSLVNQRCAFIGKGGGNIKYSHVDDAFPLPPTTNATKVTELRAGWANDPMLLARHKHILTHYDLNQSIWAVSLSSFW